MVLGLLQVAFGAVRFEHPAEQVIANWAAGSTLSLYALGGEPRLVASQTMPGIPATQTGEGG